MNKKDVKLPDFSKVVCISSRMHKARPLVGAHMLLLSKYLNKASNTLRTVVASLANLAKLWRQTLDQKLGLCASSLFWNNNRLQCL